MGYPHFTGDCDEHHDRVIDWGGTAPKGVITLCGSSRFYEEYVRENYRLTMDGYIVLSIGFYPHSAEVVHGEGVGATSEEKVALDELHKRKIDMADAVHVINVGGYIGDSTRSEIAYATEHGKNVTYMEARA